jgi:hypothetical protein
MEPGSAWKNAYSQSPLAASALGLLMREALALA